MDNRVHVLVTMDCERPVSDIEGMTGKPTERQSGPGDRLLSERSIQGYWNIARRFGFPVTFFIHPELGADHRDLFLQLEAEGACLGLHLHPWKFGNGRYPGHLGGFSEELQRQMISEAMHMWETYLGRRPLYFRPGTFSANDSTFRVLHELGFRGGSLSCPGRIWPEYNAVWAGTERHPHRAHPHFRQAVGDMDFANVPLTVNIRQPLEVTTDEGQRIDGEPVHRDTLIHGYHDLRPDRDVDHREHVRDIVDQLVVDNPAIKTISIVTHNDHDFSDPEHPWSKRLVNTLTAIRELAPAAGLEPIGSTVSDICDRVLAAD